MKNNVKIQDDTQSLQSCVRGSFYREIMDSKEMTFYGKLIKQYSNHEIGNIYYIVKQHDGALYSGDSRGIGQEGWKIAKENNQIQWGLEASENGEDSQLISENLY